MSLRAGIVLAGGFSTRFGDGDKALATLDEEPLLAHAINNLAPAVDGIVVSCREDQLSEFRPILASTPIDVAVVPDPIPDRGPSAGLANSLRTVSVPSVAVAAVDMPFIDAELFEELFELAEDREGAVPEVSEYPQPTHAVFRTEPLERAARRSVESGGGSLQEVVAQLDVAVSPQEPVQANTGRQTFVDVNTPADLREAREAVEGKYTVDKSSR